ncbi:MAG: hypothetical protein U0931_17840 [Vulcanimicrobiota bacterium]
MGLALLLPEYKRNEEAMSTNFDTNFYEGDPIEVNHVKQYAQTINEVEAGQAFYRQDLGGGDGSFVVDFSDPEHNAISDLTDGMLFTFKAAHNAGGPSTLYVVTSNPALGSLPITKNGGDELQDGDILEGQMVLVLYNSAGGGRFELIGGSAGSSGGGSMTNSLVLSNLGASLINARFVLKQTLSAGTGHIDFGPVPTGKRWKVLSLFMTLPSGSVAYTTQLKSGGSYYSIMPQSYASPGIAPALADLRALPVLEAGESYSILAGGAGLSISTSILEFDATSAFQTVKSLSLSSGNNTLYTCPTGKTAVIVGQYGSVPPALNAPSGITYLNLTGSNRTYYVNVVKSGDSPSAPGAGSNSYHNSAVTITDGVVQSIPSNAFLVLEAGDFINLNVDSGGGNQAAWVSVLEF